VNESLSSLQYLVRHRPIHLPAQMPQRAGGCVFIHLYFLLFTVILSGEVTAVVVRREKETQSMQVTAAAKFSASDDWGNLSVAHKDHGKQIMEVTAFAELFAHDHEGKQVPSQYFSWNASQFSKCAQCNNQSYRYRSVECRDVFSGLQEDDINCKGLTKLNSFELCYCGLEVCELQKGDMLCPGSNDLTVLPNISGTFEELGCSKFDQLHAHRYPRSYFDMTCANLTENTTCRYGLPFYSFRANPMTAQRCFENCSTRGYDVFGVLESKLCYCGASTFNEHVWSTASPKRKQQLVFDTEVLGKLMPWSTECPLKVYRYSGPFESGVLPQLPMGHHMIIDVVYMHTIASGVMQDEEMEEDGRVDDATEASTSTEVTHSIHRSSLEKGRRDTSAEHDQSDTFRRCWPEQCAAGKPWHTRAPESPSGSDTTWKEYVIIEYMFQENLEDVKINTFKKSDTELAYEDVCAFCREGLTNYSRPILCEGRGLPPSIWASCRQHLLLGTG